MSYVSGYYLGIFLPISIIVYQLTKAKYRWIVLLLASAIFFYLISKILIIFLLIASLTTYFGGLYYKESKSKLLSLFILCLLGLLVFLKYSGFIAEVLNFNKGNTLIESALKIGVPIGISFYTLQAISYLIDVKRKQIEPETNFAKLTLYLMFFPTIVEGPIHRYAELSTTLYTGQSITYENLTFGAQRILWGLFKKMVIADRLNTVVVNIFDVRATEYSGAIILFGAIAYTIQLYMDFSGAIDISLGSAEIFGVRLKENFRQPFFSTSVAEFWKRWHISLGGWFKEYVFYPVLLSKKVKKTGRKIRSVVGKKVVLITTNIIALFAVWFCNGLWHGSGWRYLAFGMYYFVILSLGVVIGDSCKRLLARMNLSHNHPVVKVGSWVRVCAVVIIGELIFRANGLRMGVKMILQIFTNFQMTSLTDGSILKLGLQIRDYLVLAIALAIVLTISICKEKDMNVRQRIASWWLPLRWMTYYGIIILIIVFGATGNGYIPADIIYGGF